MHHDAIFDTTLRDGEQAPGKKIADEVQDGTLGDGADQPRGS